MAVPLSKYKIANEARGKIISLTISLERVMDWFICCHFCDNDAKAGDLLELLVSERMEFGKKAECLAQILRRECEATGEAFNTKYPRILTDLQEISEDRNKFAHCLSLPTEDETTQILLVPFKNKMQQIHFTEAMIRAKGERILKYVELLHDRCEGRDWPIIETPQKQ